MATINFYLDKPDRKNKRPIILTYLLNGKKTRFYTKLKTSDKDWNKEKQKVKKNGEGESEINFQLAEFIRIIEKTERDARLGNGILSLEYIKSKLFESTGESNNDNGFFSIYEEYINSSKTTKREATVKAYRSTLEKLKIFESYTKSPLSFNSIDNSFYIQFTKFLLEKNNLVNNSIGKHIKVLKSFMTYATDLGFNNNYAFKKYKILKEDADIIYLKESELFKIYNFPNFPIRLETVKDVFCLGCFTGLRFSDLAELKETNIKEDYIELKTIKTRASLRIPLNKYAKEILKKYDNKAPRVLTNQKMNEYLKEIGQLAEINEQIVLTQYKGAEKLEKKEPKYNFISSHTARRTFVTLSLEKGMRPEVVMSITGHKDYKTFNKYIKLTDNVKHSEMLNAWND
jgi:site-specific recombinase XerD